MRPAGPHLSPGRIHSPDDGDDGDDGIGQDGDQDGSPPRVRSGAPPRRPSQAPPAAGRGPLPGPGHARGHAPGTVSGCVSGPRAAVPTAPITPVVSAAARWLIRRARQEEGAGTVMALAVIAVALGLALGAIGLIQAQAASGRARQAADLAALAGATALSSILAPGDPCAMAERVAVANGAGLASCLVSGEDVRVEVLVPATILGIPRQASASARAGPVNPLP